MCRHLEVGNPLAATHTAEHIGTILFKGSAYKKNHVGTCCVKKLNKGDEASFKKISKTYAKVPSDHFSQTNLKQILFTYMLIEEYQILFLPFCKVLSLREQGKNTRSP